MAVPMAVVAVTVPGVEVVLLVPEFWRCRHRIRSPPARAREVPTPFPRRGAVPGRATGPT
ncbi:hypothetical protein ACFQ1S_12575, partial [Kibdelosporangium lantanae]